MLRPIFTAFIACLALFAVSGRAPAQGCYGGSPGGYSYPAPGGYWFAPPSGYSFAPPNGYYPPNGSAPTASSSLPFTVRKSRDYPSPLNFEFDRNRRFGQTRIRLQTGMRAPGGGRYVCGPDGCFILRD